MTEYSENTASNAAPKRPAVRETVSRKAREAQESAKATASLASSTAKASAAAASNTAKASASSATAKASELTTKATQKLPFDVPKFELPKIDLPKVEIPSIDDLKRDVEKVAGKGAELANEAKKAVESTVTLVREAVGR